MRSLTLCVGSGLLFFTLFRVPKFESGEMEVFSSTQCLADCQRWVAQVKSLVCLCISSDSSVYRSLEYPETAS